MTIIGWVPIKRIAEIRGGSGFPHNEQGSQSGEIPFYKVKDLSRSDTSGYLRTTDNYIDDIGARRLGACIFPIESFFVAKVGAALLLHRQARSSVPSCIDNNMLGITLDRGVVFPGYARYSLSLVRLGDIVNPGAVPSVSAEAFGLKEVPLPNMGVQRAIADFLDRKTAAIDALIEKKERLIALLAEKRAALIHQAVTKGLDPNVPMKDSGVPWIGEIPAHWVLLAIKRFANLRAKSFTDGDWIESPYITDSGVRLIQTGNVGIGEYREKGFRYVSDATYTALRCTPVGVGDVLICRLDGPVGRSCIAPDLQVPMITSVDNTILKVGRGHEPGYINFCLNIPARLKWLESLSQVGGGHRWRISRSAMSALKLPCPPHEEQKAICTYISDTVGGFKAAMATTRAQILKLKEYRQSLITAAVTGQLDIPTTS